MGEGSDGYIFYYTNNRGGDNGISNHRLEPSDVNFLLDNVETWNRPKCVFWIPYRIVIWAKDKPIHLWLTPRFLYFAYPESITRTADITPKATHNSR